MTERVGADDFGGARARQFDLDNAFGFARTIRHHQDPVGELHRFGDVVGDQQRRLLQGLLDLQHLVAEQQSRLLVERGEGLVHQQDFRLGGERAGERDALAHAAGEFDRMPVLEAVQAHERNEMHRLFEPLRFRHALDLEREGDILDHRAPGEGRFLLEHHADRGMRALDALAGDGDRAFIAGDEPADDVEQGRLAAAGRADHREEFARPHRERDVIDGGDHAVRCRKAFHHIVDDEDAVRFGDGRGAGRWHRRNGHGRSFLARHDGGHGRRVTRLDAHIDNGDAAILHRFDRFGVSSRRDRLASRSAPRPARLARARATRDRCRDRKCAGRSSGSRPGGCACGRRAPDAIRR